MRGRPRRRRPRARRDRSCLLCDRPRLLCDRPRLLCRRGCTPRAPPKQASAWGWAVSRSVATDSRLETREARANVDPPRRTTSGIVARRPTRRRAVARARRRAEIQGGARGRPGSCRAAPALDPGDRSTSSRTAAATLQATHPARQNMRRRRIGWICMEGKSAASSCVVTYGGGGGNPK